MDGAARTLNVSSLGISRAKKHAERPQGMVLFERKHGRYSPTNQAKEIVEESMVSATGCMTSTMELGKSASALMGCQRAS